MLTLGKIFDDFQADYIPSLTELKAVKRSVTRVVDDLNSKTGGLNVFDKGLELIVAPTTEALTFAVATQDIVLTTTPTATVKPGDVIVVYDSVYNNRQFTISRISTATIYPIPSQPVFAEAAVTCTYAIYRPWRKKILDSVVHTDISYLNGGGAPAVNTATSVSLEVDFLELGAKAGDLVLFEGATAAKNNSLYEISSLTATALSMKTLGSSGDMTTAANDIGIMTIFSPDDFYLYDLENHRFSIPKSVKQLQQVYDGDITGKVDQRSDVFVVNADNTDTDKYATTARNLYSLTQTLFTGAGDILTFKVKRDLVAPQSAYRAAEIDIPQAYEHALKKGVLADLFSLPKYQNADMLKDQRGLYASALIELFGNEAERDRPTNYLKDYLW
jgi:hypothetical protein